MTLQVCVPKILTLVVGQLDALAAQLAVGRACAFVDADTLTGAAAAAAYLAGGTAVQIAPAEDSTEGRTEVMSILIEELVADGLIPQQKL